MIDFLQSIMSSGLLPEVFKSLVIYNGFGISKCLQRLLIPRRKPPLSKLDMKIDKGDFHCNIHLSR